MDSLINWQVRLVHCREPILGHAADFISAQAGGPSGNGGILDGHLVSLSMQSERYASHGKQPPYLVEVVEELPETSRVYETRLSISPTITESQGPTGLYPSAVRFDFVSTCVLYEATNRVHTLCSQLSTIRSSKRVVDEPLELVVAASLYNA